MIKNQQKWIALLVACTFVWLLQVSFMPLNGADASKQINSSDKEQGPSFVEEEGNSGYRARKSSALPLILGVVAVGAAVAVLVLVVLKTKYDIVGVWTVNYTWEGSSAMPYTITFSGNKKNGTFVYKEGTKTANGTYIVDTKNVEWTFTNTTKYSGTFTDKQNMSGTMLSYSDVTGTWTATKNASTSAYSNPLASIGKKGMNGAGDGLQ